MILCYETNLSNLPTDPSCKKKKSPKKAFGKGKQTVEGGWTNLSITYCTTLAVHHHTVAGWLAKNFCRCQSEEKRKNVVHREKPSVPSSGDKTAAIGASMLNSLAVAIICFSSLMVFQSSLEDSLLILVSPASLCIQEVDW